MQVHTLGTLPFSGKICVKPWLKPKYLLHSHFYIANVKSNFNSFNFTVNAATLSGLDIYNENFLFDPSLRGSPIPNTRRLCIKIFFLHVLSLMDLLSMIHFVLICFFKYQHFTINSINIGWQKMLALKCQVL